MIEIKWKQNKKNLKSTHIDGLDDDGADIRVQGASGCDENIGGEEEGGVDAGHLLEEHEPDSHQQRFGRPPAEHVGKSGCLRLLRPDWGFQPFQFRFNVVVGAS